MTAVAAYVATQETTTSTTYADLATTTDTVTATIGASGNALVCIYGNQTLSTTNYTYIGYALSGANTRAADDGHSVAFETFQANGVSSYTGASFLETGLTPGSTTFKMKYRVGTGTGYFQNRRIVVIPIENLTTASTAAAYVATGETTASATYTDLATTTDTVTATIGASGNALVCLVCYLSNSTAAAQSWASYALSGANTRAADDPHAVMTQVNSSAFVGIWGTDVLETGLTPGSTTFKMKYRASSGTGAFYYRRIAVIPL